MIGAVLLAAGQSRRMGRNKMLLPFGTSTVLETIVTEVAACPAVTDLVVVTGHESDRIAALLASYPVRCVFNPAYAQADMLVSIIITSYNYGRYIERCVRSCLGQYLP